MMQLSLQQFQLNYAKEKIMKTYIDNVQLQSICFFTLLRLKVPIMTAADDIHKYFFHCFSEKIRLDASSESSARQRIHVKYQALFSSKDKSKKLKCRLLQFLFGALRVKTLITYNSLFNV